MSSFRRSDSLELEESLDHIVSKSLFRFALWREVRF